jgi:DNA-binding transcriptional ArsR family regulator
MSTNSTALACQLEDFKQLDNLAFYKNPHGYVEEVLKTLPGYVVATYFYLLEQSMKNYKKRGIVVQSAGMIGKAIFKSARTVERHLSLLRKAGYIRIVHAYNRRYRTNYIEVICPKSVLENLLSAKKPIRNSFDILPTRTAGYTDTDGGHNNRNIDQPNIKTNIRETSSADNLEQVPVSFAQCTPSARPVRNEVNETTDPSYIFSDVPCETFVGEGEPGNFKPLEFEGIKNPAEVARFITKAERTEVVKKVKAMKRDGEIHPNVQASYQDIMVLVQHVIVHCVYRNVLRYKSFKHALNAAAKGLRNGTWTTPKRVLAAETTERERLANEAKERERRQCLDSGVGRMLGEAMRLTHGPSETDIARLKADVLECGVNSLGQNASSENIARLKEIIQKTVEDKQKGLKR